MTCYYCKGTGRNIANACCECEGTGMELQRMPWPKDYFDGERSFIGCPLAHPEEMERGAIRSTLRELREAS